MPCFSFSRGKISSGIELKKSASGISVFLGEEGCGRKLVEVPVIGNASESQRLLEAAMADLGQGIFGLIQSEQSETNTFLIRINSYEAYTRRGNGLWNLWKGSPTVVTKGNGADGDAGGIGRWDDGLIILHEGDVIRIRPSGDGPDYALFVKNNKPQVEDWIAWELKDAERNPNFYVAKGMAPQGHIPPEWIGRVVTTKVMGLRCMRGGSRIPCFDERQTGELISVKPLVLNLGWDGCDRHDEEDFYPIVWVVLTEKKVRRLAGEEAEKRKLIRDEAEELRKKALLVSELNYFSLAKEDIRREIRNVAEEEYLDTMKNGNQYEDLNVWVKNAQSALNRFASIESELKSLDEGQGAGKILVDFGGHFRTMGATKNAQYWVIEPDGLEREPDEISHRKGYLSEGDKKWRQVNPEELAISWFKSYTAAEHVFFVDRLPDNGCTSEQLATVARLEQEISAYYDKSVGLTGKTSPEIGDGWNLGGKSELKEVDPKSEIASEPVDLSQIDLSKLFDGGANIRQKNK